MKPTLLNNKDIFDKAGQANHILKIKFNNRSHSRIIFDEHARDHFELEFCK